MNEDLKDLNPGESKLLSELLDRYVEGSNLDGIRCGEEIRGLLESLSSLGFLTIEKVEEVEDGWSVDVELELEEEQTSQMMEELEV